MTIERGTGVHFDGLLGGKNASAVVFVGDRALVVADEMTKEKKNVVQAFESKGDVFKAREKENIELDPAGTAGLEMDLEGICADGRAVYVLGSHSARRKKVDPKDTRDENRRALLAPAEPQRSRDVLLKLTLDSEGKARSIDRWSLSDFLGHTEPFRSFRSIASKENGVDAEGLAFRAGSLYVGFRGPVLRGNYTPVIRCEFGGSLGHDNILFVDIEGRGVRDLAACKEGLLILAGPVGDGPGSYALYLWDGEDCVPGADAGKHIRPLGDLPLPDLKPGEVAKAEGIAVFKDELGVLDVVVVFDGLANGHATRYRIVTT